MVGYKAYEEIASELGLEYKTKGVFPFSAPHLEGVYRGREIKVYDEYAVRTRSRYRIICVKHRANIPHTIQVEYRPLLFGKKKGITFNDPAFDKNFLVKGEDEMLVRRILTLDMRKHISEALGAEVEINNESVICKWLGVEVDEDNAFLGGKKYIDKLKEIVRININLAVDMVEKIEKL